MNILLSHGSPDEAHRQSAVRLAGRVADELGEPVGAAFLGEELPTGAKVLPLFLTRGKHSTSDAPAMIAASGGEWVTGPADHPAVVADMALDLAVQTRGKQRAVMFALRYLGEGETLMTELYDRSKQFPLPSIAGLHGQCNVASVLALWQDEGLKEVLVQPILLFAGHTLETLKGEADATGLDIALGPVLSEHEGFAHWLASHFREAI